MSQPKVAYGTQFFMTVRFLALVMMMMKLLTVWFAGGPARAG